MEIEIKNLKILATVGIYPEEKENPQTITVDVIYKYDANPAVKNDDIETAIDYDEIAWLIEHVAAAKKYNLIETLAKVLVDEIKKKFKISKLSVTVHKLRAIKNAESVSATATS